MDYEAATGCRLLLKSLRDDAYTSRWMVNVVTPEVEKYKERNPGWSSSGDCTKIIVLHKVFEQEDRWKEWTDMCETDRENDDPVMKWTGPDKDGRPDVWILEKATNMNHFCYLMTMLRTAKKNFKAVGCYQKCASNKRNALGESWGRRRKESGKGTLPLCKSGVPVEGCATRRRRSFHLSGQRPTDDKRVKKAVETVEKTANQATRSMKLKLLGMVMKVLPKPAQPLFTPLAQKLLVQGESFQAVVKWAMNEVHTNGQWCTKRLRPFVYWMTSKLWMKAKMKCDFPLLLAHADVLCFSPCNVECSCKNSWLPLGLCHFCSVASNACVDS